MLLKNWSFKNSTYLKCKTPTLLSWCFVFLSIYTNAQINLVQNPSFEDTIQCPTFVAQINFTKFWNTLVSGGGGSPELFSSCANGTVVDVPQNFTGYQYPRSFENYSGIVCYDSRQIPIREYMQNKLVNKLSQGKAYCVTYYLNLADSSNYAIDMMGAYLDNGAVQTTIGGVINNVSPQIQSPVNLLLSDRVNWSKIQGSFIANGTEEYLTIGNFISDALTNTITVNNNGYDVAYYFIEDVSVIDVNSKATAGLDKLICVGDSAFIGAHEEALDCQWFNNTTQIGNGAGIWVKPTTNQQYVIEQDVCGILSYDTVQVIIKDINCNPITSIEIPNTFTPNGDGINDVWQFSLGADNILNSFEIYNRWGILIHGFNSSPSGRSGGAFWDGRTTSGEPCIDGVYFYVLKYTDAKGEQQNQKGYISLFK